MKRPRTVLLASFSGEDLASFRYEGHGGVQLSSPLRRLAAALHFTDLNLLISSNLNSRSRILLNRDVRDRGDKAAPFPQSTTTDWPPSRRSRRAAARWAM